MQPLNEVFSVVGVPIPILGMYASAYRWRSSIFFVTSLNLFFKFGFRVALACEILLKESSEVEAAYRSTQLSIAVLTALVSAAAMLLGVRCFKELKQLSRNTFLVMVIGLENSGKSALLSHVVPSAPPGSRSVEINPTPGLKMHEFFKWQAQWRVWDMSGHGRSREMWQYYYSDVHCVVFVVDCSDVSRIGNAQAELKRLMEHPDIQERRPALLVFGNKCDLVNHDGADESVSPERLENILQLNMYSEKHRCKVLASNGITGSSSEEGFQ